MRGGTKKRQRDAKGERRINPLTYTYGHSPQYDDRPNVNITDIARSTYYTSRANGSKAARACLRFRPKILERKS